jgi:hypothetical protein
MDADMKPKLKLIDIKELSDQILFTIFLISCRL